MPDPLFSDFLRRVRAGDGGAAQELVRRYESAVRVAVRVRLTDPGLKRQFDSVDICQSVLHSFFVRAAIGEYELDEPKQLLALLVRMAQNKLAYHARYHRQQRRDVRRAQVEADAALDAFGGPSPSQVVANRELLDNVRARLSADERALADARAQGHTWDEIAQQLGGTAQARRKQLSRALDRVAHELGLEPAELMG
jgi:RNA polymerase sigma-70 factor (ECF subfamily)